MRKPKPVLPVRIDTEEGFAMLAERLASNAEFRLMESGQPPGGAFALLLKAAIISARRQNRAGEMCDALRQMTELDPYQPFSTPG
jgi:hypothetical protein